MKMYSKVVCDKVMLRDGDRSIQLKYCIEIGEFAVKPVFLIVMSGNLRCSKIGIGRTERLRSRVGRMVRSYDIRGKSAGP